MRKDSDIPRALGGLVARLHEYATVMQGDLPLDLPAVGEATYQLRAAAIEFGHVVMAETDFGNALTRLEDDMPGMELHRGIPGVVADPVTDCDYFETDGEDAETDPGHEGDNGTGGARH